MALKIYHNPRCSKSRETLKLLTERGTQPEVVEYLKTPPSVQDITQLLGKLGLEPRELMRRNEPEYQENDLDRADLSREDLILAIHQHPKLLQRPIVERTDRAVVARPPEKALDLL